VSETSHRPIGIGLAGCGRALHSMFGPVLPHLKAGRLAALCDTDGKALKAAGEMFPHVPRFKDFEEMLGVDGLDAVLVATPVYAHHDQVLAAAKAGKHVLCEKPLGRSLAECDEMDRACSQAGVVLMVGLVKRFDRSFRRAAEMIESGQLGRIVQMRFDWGWPDFELDGWRDTRRTWGGVFQDRGTHTVDLACWWAGAVAAVSASVGIWVEGRQVEDQAVVVLEHASGAVSLHQLSRVTHVPFRESIQIDGSKASLVMTLTSKPHFRTLDPFQMTLFRHGEATDVTPEPYDGTPDDLPASAKYLVELEHFCQCVRDDVMPEVGAAQGRYVVEVVNAAYMSAAKGEKVVLPVEKVPSLDQIFRDLARLGQKIKPAKKNPADAPS